MIKKKKKSPNMVCIKVEVCALSELDSFRCQQIIIENSWKVYTQNVVVKEKMRKLCEAILKVNFAFKI